jgi:Na+/proline symporter
VLRRTRGAVLYTTGLLAACTSAWEAAVPGTLSALVFGCVQVLGGWTVLAILCASMSTATGAILATSTVMAHNIFRKVRATYRLHQSASDPLLACFIIFFTHYQRNAG